MLHAFLLLILLQLAGELLAGLLGWPLPGMILGLLLLLGLLALRGHRLGRERAIPEALDAAAKGLHGHFGLLFVPAGVGVLGQAGTIAAEGPAILLSVLVSTALTIGLTASLAAGLRRRSRAGTRAAGPAGALAAGEAAR